MTVDDLVERHHEMATLEQAITDAFTDLGRFVLVTGPAGAENLDY